MAGPESRRPRLRDSAKPRFTIDASVFVNAFHAHEPGHAESAAFLAALYERDDPIIVPTLLLAEIASAVARFTDNTDVALGYLDVLTTLPNVALMSLSRALAKQAATIAARQRVRGADAVYLSVAQRYATTMVSCDAEQLTRGSRIVVCKTPEQALNER